MSSMAQKKDIRPLDYRSFVHNTIDIDWDKSIAGRQHEGIVVVDAEGKLVYASDTFLKYLGIGFEEAKGQNYEFLAKHLLYNRQSLLLDTLETGINYEGLMDTFEFENQLMYLEFSTMLLVNDNGSKIGGLMCIRNVTARINGVKHLQQYETMRTINSFATSMSHHLKNPLTAVAGFLQLIKDQTVRESSMQYCDWALEELDRIEAILDRISQLALPTGGQQLITVPSLLQGIKRTIQTTAATMQVNVILDDNPPAVIIKGHYEQLREAVMCLVNNGMEAMLVGGNLTVSAHYHRSSAMVEIRVVDEGSGRYHLENIFQPFFSSSVDRTGLGLNIAEHIAMVHRGYIRLKPKDNGSGTTASLFLPAAVNISTDPAGIGVN